MTKLRFISEEELFALLAKAIKENPDLTGPDYFKKDKDNDRTRNSN